MNREVREKGQEDGEENIKGKEPNGTIKSGTLKVSRKTKLQYFIFLILRKLRQNDNFVFLRIWKKKKKEYYFPIFLCEEKDTQCVTQLGQVVLALSPFTKLFF